MAMSIERKAYLKERAAEEFWSFLALFVYLAFLIGGFMRYRQLVLAEYHVDYTRYGYGLVEALILAKVVLIGEALKIGRILGDVPRIIIVLFKTLVVGVMVAIFSVGEHFLRGAIDGLSTKQIVAELFAAGKDEILAQALLMTICFIPMFALIELARALGEKGLHHVFLQRPSQSPAPRE